MCRRWTGLRSCAQTSPLPLPLLSALVAVELIVVLVLVVVIVSVDAVEKEVVVFETSVVGVEIFLEVV